VVVEARNGDAATLSNTVHTILQRLDPDVPLQFRTLDAQVRDSVADRRFVMLILGGFSLTALLLAAVGIYGVVSHTVAQRTREMGIRMALGADGKSVRLLVMGGALRMVLFGLAGGVLGSLVLSRTMSSLLYEVSPWDPTTLVLVVLALLATALLASWIPARSGTRVDPVRSMRVE
jgi:putative ABC transport system permease protein